MMAQEVSDREFSHREIKFHERAVSDSPEPIFLVTRRVATWPYMYYKEYADPMTSQWAADRIIDVHMVNSPERKEHDASAGT